MFAKPNKKVVIDPRRTVPAANAEDLGRGPPAAQAQHRRRAGELADERDPGREPARPGLHRRAHRPRELRGAPQGRLPGQVPAREHRGGRPGCRRPRCARPPRLLGKPKKTSILFEKGLIWSGTQNEAVMNTYANLALLLGSIGQRGAGVRPPGRPPERLHVRLRLAAPAGTATTPQPLAGAREGDDRPPDLSRSATRCGCSSRRRSCSSSSRRCRSSSTSTSALRHRRGRRRRAAPRPWGEYTYTRENLERRLRVNQQFYDPPGEVARRVPDLRPDRPAARRASTACSTPASGSSPAGRTSSTRMRQTSEGKALGIDKLTPAASSIELGTNGIQQPDHRARATS